MLLGGFTTQNSDAEWSDARQSQCGNILLDYYRTTGKIEYLERGVAALRAQFPISPSENWAHVGYGAKAGVSSFHWGTGSDVAGIEIEGDYLHDAIVDVAAGQGVGVNGLNLTECIIRAGRIRMSLSSPFKWPRPPVIVFRRTDPSRSYEVLVNGSKAGSWRGEELEKGISLPFAQEQSPPSKTYTTRFEDDPKPPPELVEWFTPQEKYRADFGGFRSPLLFADGTPVRTAADWQRRRAEILATWHKLMGPWPPLIERLESQRESGRFRFKPEIAPFRGNEERVCIPGMDVFAPALPFSPGIGPKLRLVQL
jgi:hypothetical protein